MVSFLLIVSFRYFWKVTAASLCMTAFSHAAGIETQLDRESVVVGKGAILTIKILGSSVGNPEIPEVENLIFNPRGQSKQIQMINGETSVSITFTYVVGSEIPGEYEIPSINMTVDGENVTSQPLKLKVLESNVAQPQIRPIPNPTGQQPEAEKEEFDSDLKRFGFLTVELADSQRKHAYVGEIAPVRIRAWLPANARVQLRSGIQPEGKGFTLHNVSEQPQQTQEIRDGKPYVVVTWFGGMSAAKAGKYPASLSVDAKVAVRDSSKPKRQRRQTGSPFDDPFFDNAFDQMNVPMIEKDVTLKSDDQEIEVRPLPTENRPVGFSGAVGEFKFEGVEIPKDWKTGEPLQISARIAGSGNFALVNAPEISPINSWKVYPSKDEFQASDQTSFSGNKSFGFSAVPLKGGEQNIALSFSYFDPSAESYKTMTTPTQTIQVGGEDVIDQEPVVVPGVNKEPEKSNRMAPQHLTLTGRSSLIPLVSRPVFIPILATSGLFAAMGGVFALLRHRRDDPQRRSLAAMEKATHEALETVKKCVAARDVTGFFAAARLAIQHRLGQQWNQPAQAITLAEINARIPGNSPIVELFREADRHEYSGQSRGEVLPHWQMLLQEAISSITPIGR